MDLVPSSSKTRNELTALHQEDEDALRGFISASRSDNTKRAYKTDLSQFTDWCRGRGYEAIPSTPKVVAAYASYLAQTRRLKPSTIERKLASISAAHTVLGKPSPVKDISVRSVMAGIRKTVGVKQKQARPLLRPDLLKIVQAFPSPLSLQNKRDKALLLLGFACALRRSELVALNVEDLGFQPEGLSVTIRKSKTDQEKVGATVYVPRVGGILCPVEATYDWIMAAKLRKPGPLFVVAIGDHLHQGRRMAARGVSKVVKKAARLIGLDATYYSGHSLRAGFVTAAYGAGHDAMKIGQQTRHVNLDVLRRYVRPQDPFGPHNPVRGVL